MEQEDWNSERVRFVGRQRTGREEDREGEREVGWEACELSHTKEEKWVFKDKA